MGDVANAAAAPDGVWQRIFTEYIFYNHKFNFSFQYTRQDEGNYWQRRKCLPELTWYFMLITQKDKACSNRMDHIYNVEHDKVSSKHYSVGLSGHKTTVKTKTG